MILIESLYHIACLAKVQVGAVVSGDGGAVGGGGECYRSRHHCSQSDPCYNYNLSHQNLTLGLSVRKRCIFRNSTTAPKQNSRNKMRLIRPFVALMVAPREQLLLRPTAISAMANFALLKSIHIQQFYNKMVKYIITSTNNNVA